MSIASRIARALEDGALRAAPFRPLADAWGRVAARGVVRTLRLPEGARVFAVGGATLGGSGKTPLAIALALRERAAIVGHAYRASPGRARWVSPDDDVAIVGDEALACARIIARAGGGARVAVAPTRQEAIDFAARDVHTLVLDGVAQTAPRRATCALLAVDAEEPWGAGAVPPLGDLRAPKDALFAASDATIAVRD